MAEDVSLPFGSILPLQLPSCPAVDGGVNAELGDASDRRSFLQPSPEVLMRAFNAYARPILEYASPVFNSLLSVKDSQKLETVQRRFTSFVFRRCNLRNRSLGYEYRRGVLGVNLLSERRKYADLMFLYKVYTGRQTVPGLLVRKSSSRPLRHNCRLLSEIGKKGIASRIWPNNVVPDWNRIPECTIKGDLADFAAYVKNLCLPL